MGRSIELPVGLFDFEAFERRISFSELVADLRMLVEHYDTVVRADQEEQLRKFARENAFDEAKVINEHHVAMMVAVDIAFDEAPAGDRSA